ncbi:P2X purinoceptor 7-like [Littorina saxatilis]|uniref:P2X purinoceptor 7-like n=1 Tax=Littorina saxatilis TaxID=31220 RepID=UPI0038B583EE
MEGQAERQERLRATIANSSTEELRGLALKMVEAQPGLLRDLLEDADDGASPPPSAGSRTYPWWCKCTLCREMPTSPERKCCKKLHCISRLPEMEVITNTFVLHLARRQRKEILVFQDDDTQNAANRHAAYRQFVIWQFGRLGTGNRRVVPSCCTWHTRDKFPSTSGYVGFKPARIS